MSQSLYAGRTRRPRPGLSLLLLGSALLAAGCDSIVAPEALRTPAADATLTVAAAEADFRAVTRALAVAMEDRSVRISVRDAMRDSPWNEHKVVLQELFAAPEGAALLNAAAAAAGRTPAELTALVDGMPDLDFYAPSREVRRTWQGTPNVVVVGAQNVEGGRFVGFGTDGAEVSDAHALARNGRGTAVLLLHPAEPKLARSRPQPKGRGEVIQLPGDGEKSATVTWYYPNGDSVVVQVEDVLAGRDSRFRVVQAGTVTPTPVNPSQTTYAYLDYFDLNFGDGAGNVELRIEARFYGPAGDYYGMARYSDNEVADGAVQYPGLPLIAHIPPVETNARINIKVWEDDCGCWGNDDDQYGSRDYTWGDRDQTRSIYKGSTHTLDLELNWVARARPQLARYVLSDVWMEVGWTSQVAVVALDQYGYRLLNQQHSVSSWWTADPYVATVTSAGGAYGNVYGNAPGYTQLYAQIAGTSTVVSSNVQVDEPYYPPNCDPYDPYCVQ